jgi:predicted transglutaminase-like cysteine proteinase
MIKRISMAVVAAALYVAAIPTSSEAARAPKAFGGFCASNPSQCQARGASGPMSMNASRWAQLRQVNSTVNRTIREVSDRSKGRADQWSIVGSGGSGDCEDFALTKRMKLMQMGWSSSSLLVSVVRLRNGQGHAVLTVRTSEGDLVLDNLRSRITSPGSTGYRFFTRQSTSDPRVWVAVARNGSSAPAATSKGKRSSSFRMTRSAAYSTSGIVRNRSSMSDVQAAGPDFSGR